MNRNCDCIYGQAGECPESSYDRAELISESECPSWWKPGSQCANGDIYLNPFFGDLWVADGQSFVKINDGLTIDIDEPEGFIKVGHISGVINRKSEQNRNP